MAREIKSDQEFKDKLLKLIPSEIVAAYMVINGFAVGPIIVGGKDITVIISWVVFAVLLALTPLYLVKFQRVTRPLQVVVTTISFPIWVYTLGGPFQQWYQPQLASIILVLWTLIIPFAVKSQKGTQPSPAIA